MSTLIRNGHLYRRVFYDNEAHYEQLISSAIGTLLPDYWLIKFKPLVEAPELDRTCRPDCALVDKQYRQWLVVEVELECHPLERHVLPQVEVLMKGDYNETHAHALCTEAPFLDRERVARLVLVEPPAVVVIVNDRGVTTRGWEAVSTRCGAQLSFVEVFRNADGDAIVEWSGYVPALPPRLITTCRMGDLGLRVYNAAALKVSNNTRLTVLLDGKPLEFHVNLRCDLLHPCDARGLTPGGRYELLRSDDGTLELRRS